MMLHETFDALGLFCWAAGVAAMWHSLRPARRQAAQHSPRLTPMIALMFSLAWPIAVVAFMLLYSRKRSELEQHDPGH